jgi:anaphase-promoting complex subunit 11
MSDDENLPAMVATEDQTISMENGENVKNNENNGGANNITDENSLPKVKKFDSQTKLKVTIKGWNGVSAWKWIANDDTCGICRVAFDGCCPDCKLPGDDCPLVWGACTHCFHIHCIMKWLNSQQAQHLCPMCRQDWKFKES